MYKFFLLICLLALWALSGAASSNFRLLAKPTANKKRNCEFTFKSPPQTSTGKNKKSSTTFYGFLDQIDGTAPLAQNADLASKNMAGNIGSIDYDGTDCGCIVNVYSQTNFKGSYLSFDLTGKTSNTLSFSDAWAKRIQSYKVYYYN